MDEPGGVVPRGERHIGWRSVGGGAPLVLLNGYAGTNADWDPTFLAALGEHFEVVLPDHRGMGLSTWGDDAEALTIRSMADDVVALLDGLGWDSAAIAGWSMGGMVAQTLAATAPERVRTLALLSTDPGAGAVFADAEVWARLIDSSGTTREQATRLLGLLFPEPLASQIDGMVGDLVAAARAELDPAVLRAQEAAMTAWHDAPPLAIPSDSPPTLVAHGAADVVIPPANAALIAARWSAPPPALFDGCGHAVMAQVPQELADRLTEHLAP